MATKNDNVFAKQLGARLFQYTRSRFNILESGGSASMSEEYKEDVLLAGALEDEITEMLR